MGFMFDANSVKLGSVGLTIELVTFIQKLYKNHKGTKL